MSPSYFEKMWIIVISGLHTNGLPIVFEQWVEWLHSGADCENYYTCIGSLTKSHIKVPPPADLWQRFTPEFLIIGGMYLLEEHSHSSYGRNYLSKLNNAQQMIVSHKSCPKARSIIFELAFAVCGVQSHFGRDRFVRDQEKIRPKEASVHFAEQVGWCGLYLVKSKLAGKGRLAPLRRTFGTSKKVEHHLPQCVITVLLYPEYEPDVTRVPGVQTSLDRAGDVLRLLATLGFYAMVDPGLLLNGGPLSKWTFGTSKKVEHHLPQCVITVLLYPEYEPDVTRVPGVQTSLDRDVLRLLATLGFYTMVDPGLLLNATRVLLATDLVILNHGQVTWTTPELAPPLLTTTPHQREDVSALDRFNVHCCPTRFVEWAENEIAVVPDFHKRILFSDEAHFWLNGYVNKQNCRIWSEANPQVYVETPLQPEKLTVWCALWAGGILLQKR
ncbi:uncharacterized protein TNCV_735421 [Trichonephila clavipes]|uniref:Uncharacterized protein n=1 Tax=Trichonephila clavipes TaxID=2585209 RepID=A0A8X6SRV9_TRICX|nr:uncharacterized protein TNCV_735421 [Trichonephila clavipes]